MQLEWTYPYENSSFWEPDHNGLFLMLDELYFFFRKQSTLAFLPFSEKEIGRTLIPSNSRKTGLPSNWVVLSEPHEQIVCSEENSFSLNSFCWETTTPAASRLYRMQEGIKKQKLVVGDFPFGEYTIQHFGSSGFKCILNGEEQWRIKCQGYLYTDIELYDENRILFGTDGLGGRFYEIDLKSGRKLLEINTKGTNHFVGDTQTRYMFLRGNPGRVAAVDLLSDGIEDTVVLPGTVTGNNRIWKNGDRLFATSFVYNSGKTAAALLSCIKV